MITIIKEPKYYDYTGNGLPFLVQGENLIVQDGIIGFIKFTVFDPNNPHFADGDSISFLDIDTGATFTIVMRSLASGENEIYIPSTLSDLAAKLNSVEQFALYYSASAFESTLTITTREKVNTNWQITIDNHTSKLTLSTYQEGIATVYAEDYSIVVRLFRASLTNTYEEIAKFELMPDELMQAEVKIGRLIENYIDVVRPDLDKSTSEILQLQQNIFMYEIRFSEKYRVAGELKTFLSLSKKYYAFLGKINYTEYPTFDIINYTNLDKKFLTKLQEYEVYKEQNFWLNFFIQNITTVNIHLTLFFTDKTAEEQYITGGQINASRILQIPTDYQSLNLDSYLNGRTIYKYQISLSDANNVDISNKATFYLIDKPLYARQFAFINRFGVYEFFSTSGKQTKSIKIKAETYKKDIAIDYKLSDNELIRDIEYTNEIFEQSTGTITKEEAERFIEFFISPLTYELINKKYVPILIDSTSIKIIPEDKDIFSIKFNYRYAFDK